MGLGVGLASGRRAWALARDDVRALGATLRTIDAVSVGALGVALVAVGSAMLAATLLAPWAWDSLGYHLPIVHDALQTGTLRRVPTSVQYVNCYSRLIDVYFVAWRASLSDDTWMELGQLPFAFSGVVAIGTLAARAGVQPLRAVALGALWLATPVVMLELATAYVDVAVASLALLALTLGSAPASRASLALAGLTIGLLLGSKPSAPPMALAALSVVALLHGRRRPLDVALACALALSIGLGKYVENLAVYGNPLWPVELHLGPLHFPGRATMAELAENNLAEPYRSMSLPQRVLASWTAWPDRYLYDMRIGGFGPLFTFALLPASVSALVLAARSSSLRLRLRPIALPVLVLFVVTLLTPGAFWARYTLAVVAALLIVATVVLAQVRGPWLRRAGELALIALSALGIVLAWPGFTDGGPSLLEVASMRREERLAAVAVDGQEREWEAARQRVGAGHAFGYDPSFGLPGRLWREDGRGRVAYLDDLTPSLDELLAWTRRERVAVVVLGDPSSALARAHPEHFRELFASRYRDWQPCAVFEVR